MQTQTSTYDRLTQLDNGFLLFEDETSPMHVASLQIHEAAPLRLPDGAIDIERIREYVVSRLHLIPRKSGTCSSNASASSRALNGNPVSPGMS